MKGENNMFKALLLSLTTLALAEMATAQNNLVPNGSFEDTVNCTSPVLNSLMRATHWSSPNTATPDLYDCDLDRICGEPMDPSDVGGVVIQGFQCAHDGFRLAAGFQWYGPSVPPMQDTREYLMVKLIDVMEAGQAYSVSLFYSRAEGYRYAIDHIGVYFGADSIIADYSVVLDLEPQVELRDPLNPYLTEGTNWVQLADTFIAVGGERWMIIGTFNGSDDVDGIVATPSSPYNYAYYYFDQVEVRPLDPLNSIPEWTVGYSGSGAIWVEWQAAGSVDQLRVFDVSGKLLYATAPNWNRGTNTIQLPSSLRAGVYLLQLRSYNGQWVKRFVKD